MNSLYPRRGIGQTIVKTETIHLSTLDDYCTEQKINLINFMKIDTEGHDFAVLKGSERMLSEKRIAMIQFEYGGCNLDSRVQLGDIFAFLQPYGYKLYKVYPDSLRFYPDYSQSLETFKYSNWVSML